METGYEAFSFYYDQLTENVEYPQRAAYFHKLIQKYCQSEGVVLLDLACGTGSLSEEFAKYWAMMYWALTIPMEC